MKGGTISTTERKRQIDKKKKSIVKKMIVMRNGDEVAVSCALTGRKLENNWVNVAFG